MSYKVLNTNKETKIYDDREHIYYNIKISPIYKDTEAPQIANSNIQTSNILNKQSDYECAVTFWALRADLPIFICPIAEGTNNNINLTNFGVCYSFGGNDYTSSVIYVPNRTFPSYELPLSPLNNNGVQDIKNEYYYVWRFIDFVDMVNTAFTNAFNSYKTAHAGQPETEPVWIQYDNETGLFSLVAQKAYLTSGVEIYMNELLYNYFSGLKVYANVYDAPNFKTFRLLIEHNFTNQTAYALKGGTIPAPPAVPDYVINSQEYESRYTWANIISILFTSSSIQTRDEYIPQITNPNLISSSVNAFNPNYRSILSYFDIIYDTSGNSGANWRQYLYYDPAIYKWIDLVSDIPLNNFNIEIFFQLTTGQLVPLKIPINSLVDIKLLFRKKKKLLY